MQDNGDVVIRLSREIKSIKSVLGTYLSWEGQTAARPLSANEYQKLLSALDQDKEID
jgi:hypothetical protein